MRKIEYSARTNEVMTALQASPGSIFDDRYAGYIVFLFGESDPEFFGWLDDNIISLDSLTGDNIAGVIFAKEAPKGGVLTKKNGQTVWPVHYREDGVPVVDGAYNAKRLDRLWSSSSESRTLDITAITYATDDVARILEVTQHLPCLVVFDADISEGGEVFRLTKVAIKELMAVLRGAVGEFYQSKRLPEYLILLKDVQKIDRKLSDINNKSRFIEHEIAWLRSRVSFLWRDSPEKAIECLKQGNIQRFLLETQRIQQINEYQFATIKKYVEKNESLLRNLSTIRADLQNYIAHYSWPLASEIWEDYSNGPLNRAKSLLLVDESVVAENSVQAARNVFQSVSQRWELIVNPIISHFPTPLEVNEKKEGEIQKLIGPLEAELTQLMSEKNRCNEELSGAIHKLKGHKWPSLKGKFRAFARQKSLDTYRVAAEKGFLEIIVKFLTPEMIGKILSNVAR